MTGTASQGRADPQMLRQSAKTLRLFDFRPMCRRLNKGLSAYDRNLTHASRERVKEMNATRMRDAMRPLPDKKAA